MPESTVAAVAAVVDEHSSIGEKVLDQRRGVLMLGAEQVARTASHRRHVDAWILAPAVHLPRLKLGTGLGRGRAAAHSSSHEPGGAAGLGRDMTGTSFCGLSELPTWRVAT